MTRVANMWGARWTSLSSGHEHKVVPQLLLGFVDTKIAGDFRANSPLRQGWHK